MNDEDEQIKIMLILRYDSLTKAFWHEDELTAIEYRVIFKWWKKSLESMS